jgi:hypothetical protein
MLDGKALGAPVVQPPTSVTAARAVSMTLSPVGERGQVQR